MQRIEIDFILVLLFDAITRVRYLTLGIQKAHDIKQHMLVMRNMRCMMQDMAC